MNRSPLKHSPKRWLLIALLAFIAQSLSVVAAQPMMAAAQMVSHAETSTRAAEADHPMPHCHGEAVASTDVAVDSAAGSKASCCSDDCPMTLCHSASVFFVSHDWSFFNGVNTPIFVHAISRYTSPSQSLYRPPIFG